MSSSLANLQLLSHFNGADGATSFTDDSVYGVTVTNASKASAELDTAVKKFGTASLMIKYGTDTIDGFTAPSSLQVNGHGLLAGDQITMYNYDGSLAYKHLTINTITDGNNFIVNEDLTGYTISVGTTFYKHHNRKVVYPFDVSAMPKKFTFRFWFRRTSTLATCTLVCFDDSTNEFLQTCGYELCTYSSTTNKISAIAGFLTSTSTISSDTFYFIEVGYDGATAYLYINGAREATYTVDLDFSSSDDDVVVLGPKQYVFTNSLYIDDFQFWTDTCLHSLASGYAVPTAEYSDVVDVKIPSLGLQTEFTVSRPRISSLGLQTEFTASKARIVSVGLQVELPEFPVLTTLDATLITGTTARLNGTFYSGISAVTEMGFVYGTSANPTILDSKKVITTNSGTLYGDVTGLSGGTTYHVRAFMTDSVGTYYGSDKSFDTALVGVSAPTTTTITPLIQILDYDDTYTATASTTSATVLFATTAGMSEDDFIVNTTRNNTSRRVDDIPSAGIHTLNATIANQAQGDSIRVYKFTDHTSQIKQETLSFTERVEGGGDLSFKMITDGTYIPRAGQYVRLNLNGQLYFTGVINSVVRKLSQDGITEKMFFDVSATQLKIIPPRRTIEVNYDIDTTCLTIVSDVVNNYLVDEGFMTGTIDSGVKLAEQWLDDCISIGDILDQCANLSGYQWYVDENFDLQFMQDPTTVSTCTYVISDLTNSFTDFRNVTVEETIDNYTNKVFIAGGNDQNGNLVIVGQQTTASILEMQNYSAGSGVWGKVERNSSMNKADYYKAEAGTSATTIVLGTVTMASHSISIGDEVLNDTRGIRAIVSSVTITSFDVLTAVSGQVAGDDIIIYDDANNMASNILKRQDQVPKVISFDTFTLGFRAGQKLQVALSSLSMSTTASYVVDEVSISHIGTDYFKSTIRAILRNESNFSTQKNPDAWDFYKNLGASANTRPGFGVQRGAINPKVTVSGTTPSNPKISDIFVKTSPTPSVQYWWDGLAWQQ